MTDTKQKTVVVGFPGMDSVEVIVEIASGKVKLLSSKVVGSLPLIEKFQDIKKHLQGDLHRLEFPKGFSSSELLLKELVLRLQDRWPLTADEPELCHCRKIPQKFVERAVVLGAHTVEQVRARTSANTGCGTCLPDVERVLSAYLK